MALKKVPQETDLSTEISVLINSFFGGSQHRNEFCTLSYIEQELGRVDIKYGPSELVNAIVKLINSGFIKIVFGRADCQAEKAYVIYLVK